MKWLSSGLTFVNATTVSGLLIGMGAGGVSRTVAILSVIVGFAAALGAYLGATGSLNRETVPSPTEFKTKAETRRGRSSRKLDKTAALIVPPAERYRSIWLWLLVACFVVFACRSFCWLLYVDGNELKIQSPNNLGDLALHVAYIKNFANGIALWPDNPIYYLGKLRYPAGTDFFNALLTSLGLDISRGLVWAGLAASAATCFAFYRWGGTFGVAAFLFNGGLAALQVFQTHELRDYQGDKMIAWKSIPLAMFVTQRGLLYALPAGLLLLCQWRARFFPPAEANEPTPRAPIPFWVELSIYASMPLFHVHTFIALSIVLASLFLVGTTAARKQLALLVGAACLPATFFVWLVTDNLHAGSMLKWQPGWVQHAGDFSMPFLQFWLVNFGAWVPLVLAFIGLTLWRVSKQSSPLSKVSPGVAFLIPAITIFLLGYLVKMAPWEWDNIKIIVWAYFIVLPFLWTDFIASWPIPARVAICVALFSSGFLTLLGGLAAGRTGYGIADRSEVNAVGVAVRRLPVEARFAAFPTYNHPLLLQGRKVALGYPGHLWTQGVNYQEAFDKLGALMQGKPSWKDDARLLGIRFLFWGREETVNYPSSKRPWEQETSLIASGGWGKIYDLHLPKK